MLPMMDAFASIHYQFDNLPFATQDAESNCDTTTNGHTVYNSLINLGTFAALISTSFISQETSM